MPVQEERKSELRSLENTSPGSVESHKNKASAFPCAGMSRCFLSGASDAIAPFKHALKLKLTIRAGLHVRCQSA